MPFALFQIWFKSFVLLSTFKTPIILFCVFLDRFFFEGGDVVWNESKTLEDLKLLS